MKAFLLLISLFFIPLVIANAQNPGELDLTFNADGVNFGEGPNNSSVFKSAIQSDGKLIIGGDFTSYNGIFRSRIARINTNGSLDTSFNPGTGANSLVQSVVLQPDGKILIGGQFTFFNGVRRNYIARLNADGSLDTSFNTGTGANNPVTSIALQPDGKIVIGGYFTTYNGTARNHIARLNADGTLDTSFNPGTGANSPILSVAVQVDGKILIAGYFSSINGTSRNYIARLNINGSVDTSFNSEASNYVDTIALQPDGRILIAGNFTFFNATARNYIARLNVNGSLDTSFNPGTGPNSIPSSISIQNDGKILVGGGFTSFNGTARAFIVRLNANGSLDTSFNYNNAPVSTISLQSDGKILIGGGYSPDGLDRLNSNGTLDSTFNPSTGANSFIFAITSQEDGKIIVGGQFTSYNGIARNRIARLNADGSLDTGFNPGIGANNNSVRSIALQPDGKILIVGDFTSYNGVARNRIARLNSDGSLDTGFNPGTGTNNFLYSVALQPDGKILIGGDFTSYNGLARNRIARLNADGSLDTSFNSAIGANATVLSIALQPDGKIVIGGGFTSYNGISRNRIARLNSDGGLDTNFNPGSGANSNVWSILIQSDQTILIGGNFLSYNGISRTNIAKLSPVGSLDNSFNPILNGFVSDMLLEPDGKVIFVGGFTTYNGLSKKHIARINSNGSLDTSFNPIKGPNDAVWCIALQTDKKILIGGFFTSYDDVSRVRIARIYGGGEALDEEAPTPDLETLEPLNAQCQVNFDDLTIPTATDLVDGIIPGTTDQTIFPITLQGTTTITWTYTDAAGNESKQNQTIVVDDTTAPVPTLANLSVIFGQCSATVEAPSAIDNCEGTITATTSDALIYSEQGTYEFTWTFDDGNGNTSEQTQTVIVKDETAPVPIVETLPTIMGECSAEVTAPTATDNCEGTITGMTSDPTSYSEQGEYTITWTYDDGNGNTSQQIQTVIVKDETAPVPTLETLPTITGECSAEVSAPTATDNCEGTITGTTTDPTSYTEQGEYTITWTFDDGNGNTSEQTQTVIVKDETAPVPALETLPTIRGECSATVTAPTATDNCEGTITGTTTDPTSYSEQGEYTIIWTFNDGNGNTSEQTQTVIVKDETAPVPTLLELAVISGQCAVEVTAPTANDACKGVITGTTTDPTSDSEQGEYTITWTFDDGNGNTSEQTQTVIVKDETAPVPTLETLPTITGECSAEVTAPTASDNCEGTITGTTTDSTSYSEQGEYNITWTFDDGNGNTSEQTQTVIVKDESAPVPTLATLPTITGECSAEVTAPTATDNCEGTITGTTTDPTSYSEQGEYTITWTFDDGNGNTSEQTQTVIVKDETAPVPTLETLPTITDECSATVTAPTATDNCEGTITGTTTDPTSYSEQGEYTITWTFDDGNGNTSEQTQTVIVKDETAPVPTLETLPTITGECSVEVTAPTATDNCEGTITGTTEDPTSYSEQGEYTITWTFDDSNGNASEQTQSVIVKDETAPVPTLATLPTITGECSAEVTAPTSTDNCEGTITGTTTDPTSYSEQGEYTITWIFDDGNGNTSEQIQSVIVKDETAPVPTIETLPTITGECSAEVSAPTASDNCEGTITGTTTDPTSYSEQGEYMITWTFDDGNGNTSTQEQTVIVDDVTNPGWNTIVGSLDRTLYCGQDNLFAQAQLLAPISSDNCGNLTLEKISGVFVPIGSNGAGTYTNTWIATDGNSNSSEEFTQVITIAGLEIDASASGTPVQVESTATLSATVTPNVAGVTVNFYLDGSFKGSTETNDSGIATLYVAGLQLNVYKVTAVVGNGCSESIAYLPVYDPNGNFVTGGGWINSPAGAYSEDPSLVGKASFGFVSKYKKGTNQVDGNTEFQFKAGNLNFKSTLHEAGTLVISGKKATYRGDGTVNGVSGFRFTITAIDGNWNGGSLPDQFRIKIWGGNGVIYDNGLGEADNSDVATTLGGGSIVIHEAKGRATKRVSTELITVDWNTPFETIKQKVDLMSASWFDSRKLALTLNTESYDPLTPGFYLLTADLVENEFFELDEPIAIQVLVQDKPKALDITLSDHVVAKDVASGSLIGMLSTIDPADDIHIYSMEAHSEMEILGNQLIWKGTNIPAAQMKVTIFSTDRAGQTISKEFVLTKELLPGEFLLYPNPASELTNIYVDLDQAAVVELRLFDAIGRMVIVDSFAKEQSFVQQISLTSLAPGMYTVQVKIGTILMTKRLIKQ